MSETQFDLVVIGGGPAGYTGAIRAAQLGMKVAVVEKRATLGGTCLNVGCIPSKALLDSSEHFHQAKHELVEHGVEVSDVQLNLKKMMQRKDKVVQDLTGGVQFLMKKNKIEVFHAAGSLLDPHTIEVRFVSGGKTTIGAKNVMLATGSEAIELPHIPFDFQNIISSTEALALSTVPEHMVVVGAGVVGLEMSSVWARLGAKITVVEFSDRIAGVMDAKLAKFLQKSMTSLGVEFKLQSKVLSAKILGLGKIKVQYESQGQTHELDCDKVLVAVGRRAFSDNLGLKNVGIETDERGRVKVNKHLQTSQPHIFAVGDLIEGPMLAHKAEEEGVAVAEFLATGYGHVNYDTVPWVIYTWPELAGVGKTEEELKKEGIPYRAGQFSFAANGRAKAMNSTEGQVKVLAHAETDRILGVHIFGPRASDVIQEAVVAMEFGASSEDLARSFHGHPTLSEALREAALGVDGRVRQS